MTPLEMFDFITQDKKKKKMMIDVIGGEDIVIFVFFSLMEIKALT